MSALSTTGHNDGITLHCLQSIAQLIPLSSAVFYRVNAYLKPEAYVLHNISIAHTNNIWSIFNH